MLSKLEIIEETVVYYSEDVNRRSIGLYRFEDEDGDHDSMGECKYHGPDGKRCAFSRCCKDDVDLSSSEGMAASIVLDRLGVDILKKEYQIDDTVFWNGLQQLHDRDYNWNENGLSEKGLAYVETLKERYK